MCSLQLLLAFDKYVSVHVSSPQNFRKKKVAKETRSNVWKYLHIIKKRTSRCLVQGQKQCGKILEGKFATNLRKHKISTRKNLKIVTKAEKARGANSTRTSLALPDSSPF